MPRPLFPLLLAGCLAGMAGSSSAEDGIFTCVDAKGHRLTSDRPIAECLDREQTQLNASGTVRRKLGPALTAAERAVLEEQERRDAEARQRKAEERRVERALLARYPDQASHDAERAKALQSVEDSIASARRRIADLHAQRRQLDAQAEFYPDRAKWPPKLRRQVDDNAQQEAAQGRYIAAQEEEKRRIDTRFDQELARLRVLWAQARAGASADAAPARR